MKKRIVRVLICTALVLASVVIAFFAIKATEGRQSAVLNEIKQNEKPPILSAEPAGILGVYEKQKVKVTAVALKNSVVSVSVGARRYKAKRTESYDGSYDIYSAYIKTPGSRMEIDSVGVVKVNAVLNETAYTLSAFQVYYSPKQTVFVPEALSTTTLKAENYVSEAETASSEYASTTVRTTMTTAVSEYIPYTSNVGTSSATGLVAVVVGAQADTRPGNTTDSTFIPYYTPLPVGTMDYITGECSSYDSEAGETREFYNLASGRRVTKKSVEVYSSGNLGDNAISTLSSYSQNGNLNIILSEGWRVPFSVDLSPQQYYKANGRSFNVKTFAPTTLSFTFYHTVSAGGTVDASGSDIISSAHWTTNPSAKTATLTMTLRNPGVFYGYSAYYDANGNLNIIIHNKIQSLQGSVILLDPGHGGTDSGALGYDGAIYESQVNIANAVELKYELERRGATVYLTRYDDVKVSLEERKNMAMSLKPDLYISLHCDGNENKAAFGTTAYYYKPMSQSLAQNIYNEMTKVYTSYIYPGDYNKAAEAQKGTRYNPFSVTRLEDCPSVLIETGYVTNYEECAILVKEETRKQIAVAIANGIENYIYSK